jgi:dolichyl-phosphate-mannose--protein O-mannosyl transferase
MEQVFPEWKHLDGLCRFIEAYHFSKTYTALVWITSVLIFAMSFAAIRWRADQAPDIFTDEIIYTRLGIRLLGEGALVWDSGDPFLVHPPLYFLMESIYLAFTGDLPSHLYSAGDILSSVYNARGLNAIFSGWTVVILFFLGKRLHGFWFGLFLAALFIFDPFAIRINRRAMLETLTGL